MATLIPKQAYSYNVGTFSYLFSQYGSNFIPTVAPVNAAGVQINPATSDLQATLIAASQVFVPVPGATVGLIVSAVPTVAPVALVVAVASSYRIRNPATSPSPVTWLLSTSQGAGAVLPIAYSAAGISGTPGNESIDPGKVEIVGLTPAQQAALAAGTLYLSAVCPAGGSATLFLTPGNGM
jgi:hypothetical protein